MSTILDALRKAQAKHEEEDGDDAAERGAAEATEVQGDRVVSDMSTAFDDVAPPDRVVAARNRPNLITAVGVGVVGLVLGIGAARTIAGKVFSRVGEEPTRVAAETSKSKPAQPADAKKSAALPEEPAAEKHAQREGRTHAAHPAKAAHEENPGEAAPSGAEAPVEANAQLEGVPPAGEPAAVPPAAAPSAAAPPPGPFASAQLAPPPRAVMGGAVAVGPDNTIVPVQPGTMPGAAAPPVDGSVPAMNVPTEPVQTVALAPPPNAPPGIPPGEPAPAPAGMVLESPPSGSPEVSLLFIKWSHDVLGRVASLRGPGGKLLLVHEGDIVEGMRVSLIRADAVELQWRGSNFLLYAAR